jgi:hypothetical protein
MAHDLFFGKTRRNWARGTSRKACLSDEVDFRLTETEMRQLADLTTTKMLADSGDKAARKKMAVVAKRVASLKAKAARGDVASQRVLRVLSESGVFRGFQSFSLGGAGGHVPNTTYRATVLKQARRRGGNHPSTKDFYHAKKAVDGVMQSAGLALYLPGAGPGRVTA